jgi:hypothetical protein
MVTTAESGSSCPFTSVRLKAGTREFFRSPIAVHDDDEWTLRRTVAIPRAADAPNSALLVWCIGSTEVMAVEWARALRWLGDKDRLPAGTSLLKLLSEM